jgi:hypothetical protein
MKILSFQDKKKGKNKQGKQKVLELMRQYQQEYRGGRRFSLYTPGERL